MVLRHKGETEKTKAEATQSVQYLHQFTPFQHKKSYPWASQIQSYRASKTDYNEMDYIAQSKTIFK